MSFERNFQNTHLDIKVISIRAETNRSHTSKDGILKAEDSKDRLHNERVEKVENASFIPLIFPSKVAI